LHKEPCPCHFFTSAIAIILDADQLGQEISGQVERVGVAQRSNASIEAREKLCAEAESKFMEDPFLNYFALGLLFFVVIVLVYGIIAIHDIPAKIAKARHHPHEDAIHAAGWISLFLLHVLWPFLWIWAMMYRPDRGWGFSQKPGEPTSPKEAVAELEELRHRVAVVEARLEVEDRLSQSGRVRPKLVSTEFIAPGVKENVPTEAPRADNRDDAQR
jgi:hypothetical protein